MPCPWGSGLLFLEMAPPPGKRSPSSRTVGMRVPSTTLGSWANLTLIPGSTVPTCIGHTVLDQVSALGWKSERQGQASGRPVQMKPAGLSKEVAERGAAQVPVPLGLTVTEADSLVGCEAWAGGEHEAQPFHGEHVKWPGPWHFIITLCAFQ